MAEILSTGIESQKLFLHLSYTDKTKNVIIEVTNKAIFPLLVPDRPYAEFIVEGIRFEMVGVVRDLGEISHRHFTGSNGMDVTFNVYLQES